MKIEVHLFARARDLAGRPLLHVNLPVPATVGDLRRCLKEMVPALSGLLEHSAIAVDNELAGDTALLAANAEVALLPPISGG
jgi:molybdopterin converting factor small subunit